MAKELNTNFKLLAPAPLDARLQVSTYESLSTIPVIYHGIKVYVVEDDVEYRYYSEQGWIPWGSSTPASASIWGSIAGDLADQEDLVLALDSKFNVTGGIITGEVEVQNRISAYNFVVAGSGASETFPYITSSIEGEPVGSIKINNIILISSADHNQALLDGTLVPETYYIIF